MAWFKKGDEGTDSDATRDIRAPHVKEPRGPQESGDLASIQAPGTSQAPVDFDERTRTVMDSVGEGVLIFDTKLFVRYQNREAERILGHVLDKALETFTTDVRPVAAAEEEGEEERLQQQDMPPRKALRDGVPVKRTVAWHAKENDVRYIEMLATPLRIEGETVGVVCALRNVEQELRLERELREFIAIASHQFRTPLASISWFLEILLSGKIGELNKEQWEIASQAREAVTRLKDTIHLTLNASTAEIGGVEINPEPRDIGKLLNDEVHHSGLFAQSREQTIKLVMPRTMPTMPVDETVFRFIIMNLLSNAMKYSPKGAEILMTVSSESRRLLISVQDQGIGIPKGDQDRIFSKFFRAENVLMKSDGTGLGLYIVKQLIDRVGGEIWFESKEGKGTTFTVAIPREGFRKVSGHSQLTPLSKSMYGNS